MKNPNYESPCLCGACTPRMMLGTSWWKNLGYNSPNKCTEWLYEQGHRYLRDWACMYCTGNDNGYTHYEKCSQCIEEVVE